MTIRRFVLVWALLVVLLTVLMLLTFTGRVNALLQEVTPTPEPMLDIPTATAVVDPVLTLAQYGLQPGDLPSIYVEQPDNDPTILDELTLKLLAHYPDGAIFISTLESLYRAYGVSGSDLTAYFTETCIGQTVFGLSTWIRVLPNEANALALFEDPILSETHITLFGWETTPINDDLPGETYTVAVPDDICPEPSTQYITEYTIGQYLVSASVYALASTDRALVEAVLENLITLANERFQTTLTALPLNVPLAIAGRAVNVRFGPNVAYPAIGILREDESAQVIALNLDNTWLKILYGDSVGWVSASVVTIEGDTRDLPREAGPVLPIPITRAPDGEAAAQDNNTENGDVRSSFEDNSHRETPQPQNPVNPTQPPQPTAVPPTATPCNPPFCAVTPPPFPTPGVPPFPPATP